MMRAGRDTNYPVAINLFKVIMAKTECVLSVNFGVFIVNFEQILHVFLVVYC